MSKTLDLNINHEPEPMGAGYLAQVRHYLDGADHAKQQTIENGRRRELVVEGPDGHAEVRVREEWPRDTSRDGETAYELVDGFAASLGKTTTLNEFKAPHPYEAAKLVAKITGVGLHEPDLVEAFEDVLEYVEPMKDHEDGGTCNFDAPYLVGVDEDAVKEAADQVDGVEVSEGYGIAEGGWMVRGFLSGQGNRRAKMAEAAARILRDHGLNARVFRQMD